MWKQVIWKDLTKNVKIRLIFKTLSSITPSFHMVCLQPNALLESYDRYGSFGIMIWGSLIVSPVIWFLSSQNTFFCNSFRHCLICLHKDFISITRNVDMADIRHPEWGFRKMTLKIQFFESNLDFVSSFRLSKMLVPNRLN